jgi:hypothetical protein
MPWASRADRIGQLHNLLDGEDLDPAARLAASEAIDELATPEPEEEDEEERSRLLAAGDTIKRLAPTVWRVGQPVLVSLFSAWARHELGLPPS